jgi:hypothetical protein
MKLLKLSLCIILIGLTLSINAQTSNLDLNNPDDYFKAFLKTRADLEGSEVVYYWSGTVFSFVPGEKDNPLFKFEGFNIAKLVKVDGGYELLTREAAFFEDLRSGEILEKWINPFTKKEQKIVQIWNDPVNQSFVFPEEYKKYMHKLLPSTDLGKYLSFNLDLFLNYPSPLTKAEYPLNSQSDTYEAAEMFHFFADKSLLCNAELNSVPVNISWTRVSPWMPFMEMGDKTGNLIFSCVGYKLQNGYSDLPLHIKKYVELKNPQFKNAPDSFTEPNETSWTYFKKLMEKQKLTKPKTNKK